MRARRGALLLAVLAVGCGSSSDKDTTTPAATATPPPATTSTTADPERKYDDVFILKPRTNTTVTARMDESGDLVTTTTIRGKAEPDTDVLLTSGCDKRGCAVTTKSDPDGRFIAKIVVAASLDTPKTAVTAEYGYDVLARKSDRVALKLRDTPPRPGRGGGRADDEPEPAPDDDLLAGSTPGDGDSDYDGAADIPSGPLTQGDAGKLVLVGDSLAEGIQNLLPGLLPGWQIKTYARTGRPLAEGMGVLSGLSFDGPTVLAMSLFTNDSPGNVAALERAVRASARRASCVIWATIVRPPLNGVSYRGANQALERLQNELGRRMVLVPWASAVAQNPAWIAGDGVHATPAGYRGRARMYADAARRCG